MRSPARVVRFIACAALVLTVAAQADAVEFSTLDLAGTKVTVCRVDVRKDHLQLFHRDENGQPFKRFERLAPWLQQRGQKLVFAMNGGMYHGNFSAVGLFVAEGKQLNPLNTANGDGNFFLKPNGVFALTDHGARIVESSAYPSLREHIILATQSGPILVLGGKLHPAFHANSESRLIRNGVGVPSPDVAIFAITEGPVNFYDFATFFRDRLHCPDALFLDGTISSLYSTGLKRCDSRMDLGPMVAVTE